MLDYLIVGLGLAGISFCEQLEKHGKTYAVICDDSQTSSLVAGGLYNPVILKRFTLAWKAREQLAQAIPFYTDLEKKLGVRLNHPLPVYRRFASIEEQNLWFEAADKKGSSEFLSLKIHPNKNPQINAPYGYGEVLGTGRINTGLLVESYKKYLQKKDGFLAENPVPENYNSESHLTEAHVAPTLIAETFNYDALQIEKDHVAYKTLMARQIVFAEGFGMINNLFFNYLPMQGSKGEYLFVKAPQLKEKNAIKSSIFVIPEGDDIYRVGANYARGDRTNAPTEKARNELLGKWAALIRCDYEVIDQVAGVRPTVRDRKPLVGRHPAHRNVYVLNGFGSRGVMTGPYASGQLFDYISKDSPLDVDMDINRFRKNYFQN